MGELLAKLKAFEARIESFLGATTSRLDATDAAVRGLGKGAEEELKAFAGIIRAVGGDLEGGIDAAIADIDSFLGSGS